MEKIVQETAQVRYNDELWRGEWASFILTNGEETKDRWLIISREIDGEFVKFEPSDAAETTLNREVVKRLADQKIEQLREHYGLLNPDADTVAITEKLLGDVWAGAWMGHHLSYYFYVDNLAAILNLEFLDAVEIVEILNQKGFAGLNGYIIIPWQEEHKVFSDLAKSTGHKRMRLGDFDGIWHCNYCQQGGDMFDNPYEETPCVKVEED